ncbi:hypothetical protein [Mesobacillus sp. S13]|uniref:hypothetical protein n=1 Tax=Mesobacillus sp. S13 TaxID=2880221 RepID=UPI001CF15A30|nr:hypothetical protein [Mesobacillus sp. S13]
MTLLQFQLKRDQAGNLIKVTNYRGYTVIQDPKFDMEAALANFEDGSCCIIIGDSFEKCSADIQEFILLHEIGHSECQHKSSTMGAGYSSQQVMDIYTEERLAGKHLQSEFEADEYAAIVMGREVALKALEYFHQKYQFMQRSYKNHSNTNQIEFVLNELEKRIANIKSNFEN